MLFCNSVVETSSPTSPSSPGSAGGGGFGYMMAFLVGCLFMAVGMSYLFYALHSPDDSRALRLPDQFVVSAELTAGYIRPTVRVNDSADNLRAEVIQWRNVQPLTGLNYTQPNGQVLMSSKPSATPGWHHLQVLSWDKKVLANVHMEDAGGRHAIILDDAGKIYAQGKQDAVTKALVLRLPEGLEVATIACEVQSEKCSVTIVNPSRVLPAVYAMMAAYELFLASTRKGYH